MKSSKKTLLALAIFSGLALSSGITVAQEPQSNRFAELCDTNKDGMVSKDEMMKRVEMAWNKADPQKKGMLDRAGTDKFIKEFYTQGN